MPETINPEHAEINLFEKIEATLRAINKDGSFRTDVTFQDVSFSINPAIGVLLPHETDPNSVWVIPKLPGDAEIKATYIPIVNS